MNNSVATNYSVPVSGRYSTATIWLHWLMALLLVGVYATMELRGFFPRGSEARDLMKLTHFGLGMCVLFLVVIRILVRLRGNKPAIVPPAAAWELMLAKLTHFALYGLMLVAPVLGWLLLSANGKSVPFFGLEIPPLVGPDKARAGDYHEWHETIAKFGYVLIGLHTLGALFHHYVRRDNTMTRMWFKRGGR